jgi:hypothetical protein
MCKSILDGVVGGIFNPIYFSVVPHDKTSFLSLEKKLSATALSWQLPLRLMLGPARF